MAQGANVAVIIPIYKEVPSELEILSLSRCVSILDRYATIFFGPRSLDSGMYSRIAPRASRRDFDDAYFSSIETYNTLLLSTDFYNAFGDFDWVLVHQLDAFVFYDGLSEWCSRPYDYVGAPWWNDKESSWWGVGNGGFSLRNVRSSLDVLTSSSKEDPEAYWNMERIVTASRAKLALKSYRKWGKRLGFRDDVRGFLSRFMAEGRPEDLFWGLHAVRFHGSFRVAPVEAGLAFAIEGGLLEAGDRYASRPPFGCHQNRFLRMIARFLQGVEQPAGEYEATVWRMAETSGLQRTRS
jgi:hypothetical protein